ncbi:LuxR C-terminal-related transcriptional regulator [Alkalinema pantanalense CENA528]|uniref:LuxR C-terminal-related transcriptional regulator n=1 Tax=Alkalinema pantanalense TaxID=1620705 RepID=UPI003D6EA807
MPCSLASLLTTIHQSQSKAQLRSQVVPQIGDYFSATRRAIFFFDELTLHDPTIQTILNTALSIERNPIARYIAERHAPVHEAMVTTPKAWRLICPRPDHWHVMAGPIVYSGQIVGALGCTRPKTMPAFDQDNLVDLGAICLHVSGWIGIVNASKYSTAQTNVQAPVQLIQAPRQSLWHYPNDLVQKNLVQKTLHLTARELQIAELVALGKTNAEIGKELWITENSVKQALKRIFRKLEVSSRAAMVARLAQLSSMNSQ